MNRLIEALLALTQAPFVLFVLVLGVAVCIYDSYRTRRYDG